MLVVTSKTFETEVLRSSKPVVVDFWAAWCGPCVRLAPIYEELAKEYEGKLKLVKLNVDENNDTAAQHAVMSIPTMIFFSKGSEVERLVGALPKESLKRKFDAILAKV